MGTDKALLPWQGATLVQHVARQVREAAGSVALVGAPERYGSLGFPVIADRHPGDGPLAGIHAALSEGAEWNLVAACDMPNLTVELLRELLETAERSGADCLVPEAGGRPQPLCAAYHRDCREPFEQALESGRRRLTDALALVRCRRWPAPDPELFANLNTPGDLDQHRALAGNPR